MTIPTPIRVFIVDDHDIVREGLKSVLGREADLEVVGEARSAEEALEAIGQILPAVAVVDHRLPGMNGVELCREIAERRFPARVVVLSGFLEQDTVEAAFLAGARAYVVKDVEAVELKRAIRAAAAGKTMIDPKVTGPFAEWVARHPRDALPPRHVGILRCLVDGKTNSEIAKTCGLTRHTVKSYLRDIYRRLGVNTRAEAVAVALRRGLV